MLEGVADVSRCSTWPWDFSEVGHTLFDDMSGVGQDEDGCIAMAGEHLEGDVK